MITAQDIREKTFDKATFGGYDMSGVDDYLEELAANATATQKEIGTLRAKMKILVDKIEEYRANEDAMRMAILSAQKLAGEIEAEAQEKADALMAEAREKADALVAGAQEKADALVADAQKQYDALTADLTGVREVEERRLGAAKEASAAYFEKAFANLERQKEFLQAIRSMVVEAPAEEEPAPVEEELPVEEAVEEAVELTEEVPAEAPAAEEEVDEPTRMFRF